MLHKLKADDLLYRTDDRTDNYWGGEIYWNPDDQGWAIIVDDAGQVVDYVAQSVADVRDEHRELFGEIPIAQLGNAEGNVVGFRFG